MEIKIHAVNASKCLANSLAGKKEAYNFLLNEFFRPVSYKTEYSRIREEIFTFARNLLTKEADTREGFCLSNLNSPIDGKQILSHSRRRYFDCVVPLWYDPDGSKFFNSHLSITPGMHFHYDHEKSQPRPSGPINDLLYDNLLKFSIGPDLVLVEYRYEKIIILEIEK